MRLYEFLYEDATKRIYKRTLDADETKGAYMMPKGQHPMHCSQRMIYKKDVDTDKAQYRLFCELDAWVILTEDNNKKAAEAFRKLFQERLEEYRQAALNVERIIEGVNAFGRGEVPKIDDGD